MGTAKQREWRRMGMFEEALRDWEGGCLTQDQAAALLGVSPRTFRRWVVRYGEDGIEGLRDRRVSRASHRAAPVDEVMRMVDRYRTRHVGWNMRHYYAWYRREGGQRSYTWVRNKLQAHGAVSKGKGRGKHRRKRAPAPWPGVMLHQDGSSHEWVKGRVWDLIVTMDDATNEHYSMFFCEEEGTQSSFAGVREVMESEGLFCSLYTDRASHYWHPPEAGGKVDKTNLTQFARAMRQDLGIDMIPAYSPEARGRSERAFRTHQGRLPQELALAGIADMAAANRYLSEVYRPAFNAEFRRSPAEDKSAFVAMAEIARLDNILCEIHERTVGRDNCVRFERQALQLPASRYRPHYFKVRVKVRRHMNGTLSIWHGPRLLARYGADGQPQGETLEKAA